MTSPLKTAYTHIPITIYLFEQMKKKKRSFFLSALIILLASGGLIAGTFAYFTARRTISQSRFAAGTLDLNVQSDGQTLQPFVIDNVGENANMSGSKVWQVKNIGTLPGQLMIQLQNVSNKENGCNDQEKAAEPNCETDAEGDLGKAITLNVSLDGVKKVSSTLDGDQSTKIGTDWSALSPIVLQPGQEVTLSADWSALEENYGNEVQSDSVSFDMDFRLIQQASSVSN